MKNNSLLGFTFSVPGVWVANPARFGKDLVLVAVSPSIWWEGYSSMRKGYIQIQHGDNNGLFQTVDFKSPM